MPRPRGFDPDQAVEAATNLFWERGYDQVSFDDLVEATGASRRGLYSLWSSKEELFAAAVARYRHGVGDYFFADMEAPDAGRKEIAAFWDKFEAGGDVGPGRGCLIMRTANQPLARRPLIEAEITGYFDRFQSAIRHALTGAVDRGEIDAGIDPATASRLALGVAFATSAVLSQYGFDQRARDLVAAGRSATGVA